MTMRANATASVLARVALLTLLSACANHTSSFPEPNASATPATAQQREWLEMFARGYFPGRSGQIFFVPHHGDFIVDDEPLYAFMHGSPWPYDTHVPLLLHWPGQIRPATFDSPVAQQDIAPTLAHVLGIAPPATTTGRALVEAIPLLKPRPRVIALIVIDGMRVDYFERHAPQMPTLSRLRSQGAWFSQVRANSMPTATSIGHATIGTGTDPRVHGLVVNQLFNRVTGKPQESYNALDPGELMALTLADVWNLATDGRARIIGQGGAIRATAGLVGHGACLVNARRVLAASYSTRDAGWETNTDCYSMPPALKGLNGERFWTAAKGTWMGHNIASPRAFRASAIFQQFEGEALVSVLEPEPIGEDDVTDLVFVNIKSVDYVTHAYGPDSRELEETLGELDQQLARAITILERKAGADGLFVAVTADHGMPGEPPAPRKRIYLDAVVAALDKRFASGGASIVHYFGDPANAQIHMNMARLRELNVPLADVAAFLRSELFAAVYTEDEVRSAQARLPLGK